MIGIMAMRHALFDASSGAELREVMREAEGDLNSQRDLWTLG